MAKEPVLKLKEIKKTFSYPKETDILQDISLEVNEGETIAIIGRSGEGKTTLLHIIGLLETPNKGSVSILGENVSSRNQDRIRNQKIGYVFQAFHLLDDYTALENVLMPARIGRKNTSKSSPAYARAHMLLDKVGLKDRANYHTKLLSGGEKQRVAIARALMNDPDIFLADEPTGNLDGENAKAIHDIIFGCAKEDGKTVIIVTHDHNLAGLCDKRYTLKNGSLEQEPN